MNKAFLKELFNTPMRKCRITKDFFPIIFMLRLIEAKDYSGKKLFIPDCLYTNVCMIF
jgi:hypothetical protein